MPWEFNVFKISVECVACLFFRLACICRAKRGKPDGAAGPVGIEKPFFLLEKSLGKNTIPKCHLVLLDGITGPVGIEPTTPSLGEKCPIH